MYGDLQGIAGKSLGELNGIDTRLIDAPTELDEISEVAWGPRRLAARGTQQSSPVVRRRRGPDRASAAAARGSITSRHSSDPFANLHAGAVDQSCHNCQPTSPLHASCGCVSISRAA